MDNQLLETIHKKLTEHFGADIISAQMERDFPCFVVKKEKTVEVIRFLYDNPELEFQFLTSLCGIHFPDHKGAELGVVYQLHNMRKNWRIRLKTFSAITHPDFPSTTSIFSAANWLERETYDFYGTVFTGHPNLKRILNMDEMNYFPLRKEYPLEDGSREDKDNSMFGR